MVIFLIICTNSYFYCVNDIFFVQYLLFVQDLCSHEQDLCKKAFFLCIIGKPVFTGVPELLCTLVQCCAPSVSRAHAKESNTYLINEPQSFHNGQDSCRKLLLYILNYVLFEYLTFL